jgi:chromosome partitioning protein
LPHVISMINWKGGVGKTTSTLHIGVGIRLAVPTAKVLLVDLDPQCNLSYLALGVEGYVKRVYQDGVPTLKNLFDGYFLGAAPALDKLIVKGSVAASPGMVWSDVDILLSHQELILLDLQLARTRKSGTDHRQETSYELDKLRVLANALDGVRDNYTHIIIDCPPNVNLVTQNAFLASDHYLVPAIPDFLSTVGISLIKQKMIEFDTDFAGMHEYARYPRPYKSTKFLGIVFNMVDEYGGGPNRAIAS